jgi:hypothetical protein
MQPSMRWLAACLLAGSAVVASFGAQADNEFSGQLRPRWDERQTATRGPLAQAAQLAPEMIPPQASAATLEAELRGRWQMLSANVSLRSVRPESDVWHSDGTVNELSASGELLA